MIVLTVIIIVSFTMWGGWQGNNNRAASPTDTAFSIYGRSYSRADFEHSQAKYQLAAGLGLYEFAGGIVRAAYETQTRDALPPDFTFNVIVLQHLMDELGIRVTDEEAMAAMQQLPAFQEDGKFSPARAKLIQENLGRMKLGSDDVVEVIKYDIGFRKLQELVAGNYLASDFASAKQYAAQYQTIQASTVAFALDTYKKGIEVSDDEIQAYYEENKDSLKTLEQRAVQWVVFPNPEGLEQITDVDARNKKQAEFLKTVQVFAEKAFQPGARLAPLAAEQTPPIEVQQAPLFAQNTPPEALKNSREVVTAIFNTDAVSSPIVEPTRGEKGFYIVEITNVEEPKEQELAAVKDRIKEILVDRKAKEKLAEAVNETKEKLQAALKEGKSLDDAAKELKLQVSALPEFSPQVPPPGLAFAYEIAGQAQATAVNDVSKPVTTDTGVLLVVVRAKELRKRPEGDNTKTEVEKALTDRTRSEIFNAWFSAQKKLGKLKTFFRIS